MTVQGQRVGLLIGGVCELTSANHNISKYYCVYSVWKLKISNEQKRIPCLGKLFRHHKDTKSTKENRLIYGRLIAADGATGSFLAYPCRGVGTSAII